MEVLGTSASFVKPINFANFLCFCYVGFDKEFNFINLESSHFFCALFLLMGLLNNPSFFELLYVNFVDIQEKNLVF